MVTIVDCIVHLKFDKRVELNYSHQKKKKKDDVVLINFIVVIMSLYICISNHSVLYLKHINVVCQLYLRKARNKQQKANKK